MRGASRKEEKEELMQKCGQRVFDCWNNMCARRETFHKYCLEIKTANLFSLS